MASTYSPSLRIELMATGDQSGTWGDTTNTNLGTLLEQSITGVLSKAMADANQTLTNLNGASDEARNMVVEATGALTAGRDMIVPTAEKLYLFKNSTTGGFAVTIKTSAGTGVAVPMNGSRWVYCDGTNVVDGQSGPLTPTTNSSAALGSSTLGWSALFIDSAAAGTLATLSSTEAGATAGPVIDLYRNSASPAVNDILGNITFNGEDSAGNKQEYGSIEAVIADPVSGSEDASVDHYAIVAGARTRIISVGPNLDLAAVGQIKFPATANPSSDANTLDDYEEGATTPTVTAGSGSLTTASCALKYTKIGRLATVTFEIIITTNGTGASFISIPLPFTAAFTSSGTAREMDVTGIINSVVVNASGATAIIVTYNGLYPGGSGYRLVGSLNYQV